MKIVLKDVYQELDDVFMFNVVCMISMTYKLSFIKSRTCSFKTL